MFEQWTADVKKKHQSL